jgi:hypothetical protein
MMSMSLVTCRCESDLRMSISDWRFSKSFAVRPLLLTVLMATSLRDSWEVCSVNAAGDEQGAHLVVALVDGGEAALAEVADDDIWAELVVFGALTEGDGAGCP